MALTSFIGAYGYGNLGDETCLIEALTAFKSAAPWAFSVDHRWSAHCVPEIAGWFSDGAEMESISPDRIVYGGGMIGTVHGLRAWMPWLAAGQRRGAEVHLHNLGISNGLARDRSWLTPETRAVFETAKTLTVRDFRSADVLASAGLSRIPGVSLFPECDVDADFSLAKDLLPEGVPLLGLSIIPTTRMTECLDRNQAIVASVLSEFQGWQVVPIVSTVHKDADIEDDMRGVTTFIRRFLPEARIAAPALLDPHHWRSSMTPRRLKGLISRVTTLVTQRKHNAVHATGTGVRVIGLHPSADDSLVRTFTALLHRLPRGSKCIGLF